VAAPSPDKDQAIADIEAHLCKFGPQQWGPLRERYAHVPEPTWWRWVRIGKQRIGSPAYIEEARRQLAARAAQTTPEERGASVAASLPAAPAPDFVAKNGARSHVQLDLLEKFEELYADAMLLREFAANSEGGIKNPLYFGQSINIRDRLISTALQAMQAVWDLRRMQELYDAVIAEVEKASPETAQAIVERLHDLNQRAGIAFDARA
jgi:hypothetical protein